MNFLANTNAEIFVLTEEGEIKEGGCNPQLWTIAAKFYFSTVPVEMPALAS